MAELDEAMREHMAFIVHREHRPFSYKDFRYFEVKGKHYRMAYGTFRNKILQFRHNNEVEVEIRSNPFFYTLKGFKFDNGKQMTGNHMEASDISIQRLIRHPLYQILEGNKFDKLAVHNLHFNFKAQGAYNNILLKNLELRKSIDKDNKGIHFSYFDINRFSIIVSVYPNNTCKVVIGCSENPIHLDFEGINRLSMALCRIEERLSNLCVTANITTSIPNYKYWIITLWHIGKDSISEYSREMFHCEWSLAEKMILRIYSKTVRKSNNRVRIEVQHNPVIDLEQLFKKIGLEKILE